jgi:hypothetical protein
MAVAMLVVSVVLMVLMVWVASVVPLTMLPCLDPFDS